MPFASFPDCTRKKQSDYRDVAQIGSALTGGQGVAGSNPVIPTFSKGKIFGTLDDERVLLTHQVYALADRPGFRMESVIFGT